MSCHCYHCSVSDQVGTENSWGVQLEALFHPASFSQSLRTIKFRDRCGDQKLSQTLFWAFSFQVFRKNWCSIRQFKQLIDFKLTNSISICCSGGQCAPRMQPEGPSTDLFFFPAGRLQKKKRPTGPTRLGMGPYWSHTGPPKQAKKPKSVRLETSS